MSACPNLWLVVCVLLSLSLSLLLIHSSSYWLLMSLFTLTVSCSKSNSFSGPQQLLKYWNRAGMIRMMDPGCLGQPPLSLPLNTLDCPSLVAELQTKLPHICIFNIFPLTCWVSELFGCDIWFRSSQWNPFHSWLRIKIIILREFWVPWKSCVFSKWRTSWACWSSCTHHSGKNLNPSLQSWMWASCSPSLTVTSVSRVSFATWAAWTACISRASLYYLMVSGVSWLAFHFVIHDILFFITT